jgi:hypothetical protein
MIEKVNSYLGVTNNFDNFKGSPINKALEKARNELYKDCQVLNEYYSLLTPTLVTNRRKKDRTNNCNVFDYKYMVNAKTFIEMHNCNLWFEKHDYINDRDSMILPNYNLTIMKKERHNNRDVYDIGVKWFHSFFANGANVHNCIPSRMTAGQLIECIASKAAALNGHFVDGTPFSDYNIREIPQILKKLGYSEHGTETMYNGMTGEMIQTEIFMAPAYYLRLKQMVEDKINYRDTGPKKLLTHQPTDGRANDGGLRIGEMERDCLISHGMSKFWNESVMERSDKESSLFQPELGKFDANPNYPFVRMEVPYTTRLLLNEIESMHISTKLAST